MDEAGERIDCVRINNDPVWFAQEVSKSPKGSHLVIEAPTAGMGVTCQERDDVVHLSTPTPMTPGERRSRATSRTLGTWPTCCGSDG